MSSLFSKILVAIDDSEPARAAAETAVRLARDCGGEVVFANAIDTRVIVDLGELVKDKARALLAGAEEKAAAQGVHASAEILVGDLVATLTAFAREADADLIVMGTRGKHGLERLLGSATEGVLRASTVPVLAVHAMPDEHAAPASSAGVVVALDDSDAADAAASLALRYAAKAQSAVAFVTVVESAGILRNAAVYGFDPEPLLEQVRTAANAVLARAATQARNLEIPVEHAILESDDVAGAILEAARDRAAGMIVMGSHGRRGLRHFLLGSVSEGVVRNSPVPVLVTRALPSPAGV